MFYFEVDFRKHVIDRNSCDWLKIMCSFGLFVNINTFQLLFLLLLLRFCNYTMSQQELETHRTTSMHSKVVMLATAYVHVSSNFSTTCSYVSVCKVDTIMAKKMTTMLFLPYYSFLRVSKKTGHAYYVS